MTAPMSADVPLLVSRNAAREAIATALGLYVGRGRRYTVKQLSRATGVKDRVIECASVAPDNPDCRPLKNCELLSIALFLGPDFTNEWLKLAQQGAFSLPDGDETPPGSIAADLSEDNAKVARAASDGVFDHTERPILREVGKHMVNTGAQLMRLKVA